MSSEPPSRRSLLRERSFVCFAVLRLFNSMALQMLNVTVGWQIYEMTSDPLDLGLIGLAQFAPVFFLFLVAGVAADRFSRRMIVIVCNFLQAAVAGAFLLYALFGGGAVWPIFALIAIHGAIRAFFQPTVTSLLANIVERRQFAPAVAISSSVLKAGFMIGPALGGVLIAFIGVWVYLVVAVFFVLGSFSAIPITMRGVRHSVGNFSLETLLGGFGFVWHKKMVLGAITLDLIAVLFAGIMGLLPVFARDILHVGPEGLGLMRATPAVGALIVGIILTQLPAPGRMGPVLFIATLVLGASTVAFSLSEVFWFSILMLAIWGGSDMVSVYVRQTVMQVATPDQMRGRVSAVSSVAINASNELGDFRAGLMAAWIGTVPAVVAGGLVTIAVTGMWWKLFPDLRRVDRLDQV